MFKSGTSLCGALSHTAAQLPFSLSEEAENPDLPAWRHPAAAAPFDFLLRRVGTVRVVANAARALTEVFSATPVRKCINVASSGSD